MDKTIVQLQEDGEELQCQDGWKALHGRKGLQAGERKGRYGGKEGAVGTAQGLQRWGCLSAARWDACHLSRLELVIQQSSFSLYFLLFRQIERFFGCHIQFISDLMPEDIRYEI